MKRRLFGFGLVCLLSVLVSVPVISCASPAEEAATSPAEIIDQLGRKVVLDKYPQRIISLAPSNTEILYALGLSDRLIAVTDYCNYPPEAEEKPSIGGFSTPNIEEIIALAPDMILATSRHVERIIPQLEDKGLTVIGLNPKTMDEVLEAILLTGRVTGTEEAAGELVDGMARRIKAVTDKTSGLPPEQRPGTFYVVWHDPLKTAGSETLQDELIRKAGGLNISRQLNEYANISLEVVISENPGVIIAGTSHGSNQEQTYLYIEDEERLRDVDARLNNRMFAIDSDLASRAGPRIVDALELFAAFIHPELFG